jgi:hypothetical protein
MNLSETPGNLFSGNFLLLFGYKKKWGQGRSPKVLTGGQWRSPILFIFIGRGRGMEESYVMRVEKYTYQQTNFKIIKTEASRE